MLTPPEVTAACHLQGTNEDVSASPSLMSVLAIRAAEIVEDVLAHRLSHAAEQRSDSASIAASADAAAH
jgi:hypothetical protein